MTLVDMISNTSYLGDLYDTSVYLFDFFAMPVKEYEHRYMISHNDLDGCACTVIGKTFGAIYDILSKNRIVYTNIDTGRDNIVAEVHRIFEEVMSAHDLNSKHNEIIKFLFTDLNGIDVKSIRDMAETYFPLLRFDICIIDHHVEKADLTPHLNPECDAHYVVNRDKVSAARILYDLFLFTYMHHISLDRHETYISLASTMEMRLVDAIRRVVRHISKSEWREHIIDGDEYHRLTNSDETRRRLVNEFFTMLDRYVDAVSHYDTGNWEDPSIICDSQEMVGAVILKGTKGSYDKPIEQKYYIPALAEQLYFTHFKCEDGTRDIGAYHDAMVNRFDQCFRNLVVKTSQINYYGMDLENWDIVASEFVHFAERYSEFKKMVIPVDVKVDHGTATIRFKEILQNLEGLNNMKIDVNPLVTNVQLFVIPVTCMESNSPYFSIYSKSMMEEWYRSYLADNTSMANRVALFVKISFLSRTVSLRTLKECSADIDCSDIASQYGGGGHVCAAGFPLGVIEATTLDQAVPEAMMSTEAEITRAEADLGSAVQTIKDDIISRLSTAKNNLDSILK